MPTAKRGMQNGIRVAYPLQYAYPALATPIPFTTFFGLRGSDEVLLAQENCITMAVRDAIAACKHKERKIEMTNVAPINPTPTPTREQPGRLTHRQFFRLCRWIEKRENWQDLYAMTAIASRATEQAACGMEGNTDVPKRVVVSSVEEAFSELGIAVPKAPQDRTPEDAKIAALASFVVTLARAANVPVPEEIQAIINGGMV